MKRTPFLSLPLPLSTARMDTCSTYDDMQYSWHVAVTRCAAPLARSRLCLRNTHPCLVCLVLDKHGPEIRHSNHLSALKPKCCLDGASVVAPHSLCTTHKDTWDTLHAGSCLACRSGIINTTHTTTTTKVTRCGAAHIAHTCQSGQHMYGFGSAAYMLCTKQVICMHSRRTFRQRHSWGCCAGGEPGGASHCAPADVAKNNPGL